MCRFSDFEQDVWSLYNLEFGDQMGKSTGWRALDEVYRVSTLTQYLSHSSLLAPHGQQSLWSGRPQMQCSL